LGGAWALFASLVFVTTGCVSAEPFKWPWSKRDEPTATADAKPTEPARFKWPWSKDEPAKSKEEAKAQFAGDLNKNGPRDSMGLKGPNNEWINEEDKQAQRELDEIKRKFDAKEFEQAESGFHDFLNTYRKKKLPQPLHEEALFFEAESQFQRKLYRAAAPSFKNYNKQYPNGRFANLSNQRMFQIADYWLEETRAQMRAHQEKVRGERTFVMPASFIHLSKDMPVFDVQGHAITLLEEVRLNDIKGELGVQALFYIATVKFFNEEYKDADFYYAQVYEQYPKSPFAPKAVKQSVICKLLSHGGTSYDSRGVEECRKIIHRYMDTYPELAKDEKWMRDQVTSISHAQADRDFNIAEFYRRTGHPASAYFYYELVKRRYPGTKYAEKSESRLVEIKGAAEREQARFNGNAPSNWFDRLFGGVAPSSSSNAERMTRQALVPTTSSAATPTTPGPVGLRP
jgi:outer membrane protein assembly factor BamD (BamD/ComL family)